MKKARHLNKVELKDYQKVFESNKYDVSLATIGIFDTEKVFWRYYLTSLITVGSVDRLTNDINSWLMEPSMPISIHLIERCREFKSAEESENWSNDFKSKWESGKNITKDVIRDNKINEVLNP